MTPDPTDKAPGAVDLEAAEAAMNQWSGVAPTNPYDTRICHTRDMGRLLIAEVTRLREEWARERGVIHDDLLVLLDTLGMGTHARPQSSREVFFEAVAEVKRLREDLANRKAQAHWKEIEVQKYEAEAAGFQDLARRECLRADRAEARVAELEKAICKAMSATEPIAQIRILDAALAGNKGNAPTGRIEPPGYPNRVASLRDTALSSQAGGAKPGASDPLRLVRYENGHCWQPMRDGSVVCSRCSKEAGRTLNVHCPIGPEEGQPDFKPTPDVVPVERAVLEHVRWRAHEPYLSCPGVKEKKT